MQIGISFTSDVFDIFTGYEIRRTCTMTSWASPYSPLGPLALTARLKGVWLEGGCHISGPRPAGLGQEVGPEGLLVYIRGPSPGSRRKAPLGARGTSLLIECLRLLAPAHIRLPGRCQSVCYFSGARAYVPAGTALHLHSGVLAFTGWPSDTYRWGAYTHPRYRMTWRTPHDICP